MHVVATAGHVDHGKSTLVRALTGMEPDRWEEERARGLTIDLGFVWADVKGEDVAFVDVPGHERFIANMLAGVGPAPAVMFVVAADEGWKEQSTDHRDAIDAFGIRTGIVALTRADNASPARRTEVRADMAARLAGTTLAGWPVVEVSAATGEGLEELRRELAGVLRAAGAGDPRDRVRFWVDRSFTIKGAGTVVTGTLAAGAIRPGDVLDLDGREVTVRGIHSEDAPVDLAVPAMRAALNLRGVPPEAVSRGTALTTPGAWHSTRLIDARRATGTALTDAPHEVVVHVGTAGVPAKVRPFGPEHARLVLSTELPLSIGDALVLRGSGAQHILAGVRVIDADPPAIARRGDGRRRSAELEHLPDVSREIARRVAVRPGDLRRLGYEVGEEPPAGSVAFSGWWIRAAQVMEWKEQLLRAVEEHEAADPLSAGLSVGAAVDKLALPDPKLLPLAAAAAKLTVSGGVVGRGVKRDLGAAEAGVRRLEGHLGSAPFRAPEAADLREWGLGPKELAAAERAGRVLRIGAGRDVVLLPDAPRRAAEMLAGLAQPFTASDARKAWGTTRRVAIPLLELLDARGVTRRVEGTARVLA
ncbi:selenocysteine-specific translation elongation factor [Corynebacterium sp. UBA2622]|uniref:selenocysteine-specific translation elongation factor n=1 Tax=Corynebacterium sp. UBA2622 TaxID=1946393 RepID=UPI0025BE7445|nr:selenocysteine-specific translation elongation factor [Corynebacterium sp. UBA2622]